MRGFRTLLCGAICLVLLVIGATSAEIAPAAATTGDALHTRVRAELGVFTHWLQVNNAKGYIGEVGWPDTDGALWNSLASDWFADADAAGLWVTGWASGEWWGNSYKLSVYEDHASPYSAVDAASTQAPVFEAHQSNGYLRGVNDNGGEFGGAPTSQATSSFSNTNSGAYNAAYHYDSQTTFHYLASRGVKIVRIPFRWERIQKTPSSGLDATEVTRLKGVIDRAHAEGLGVILDMHNYGAYYLYNGTQGVRRAVGSSQIPVTTFSRAWKLLSTAFKAYPGVVGYGLMNEPTGLPSTSTLSAAKLWEKASQAALTAIRNNADAQLVLVPGYNWSGAQQWAKTHPKAWISDPSNKFRYEAHHYWDRDNSGSYAHSYSDEVANAVSRGYVAS